jgi:hypothetical protein
VEEAAKMIKFLCDSCGRDISARVYDSIKQFCGKDHFTQSIELGVAEEDCRQAPDLRQEMKPQLEQIHAELQLLNELSKLIHASAWGRSTKTMRCGNCAVEHMEREQAKVITIFTRIPGNQILAEISEEAFSQED